jgi:hypothetical protein
MAEEHEKPAGGIAGFLSKKQGPFPVWSLILIGVGGGAVLYLYKRNKSVAGTTATQSVAASTGTVDATGSGTYQPAGGGAGSAGATTGTSSTGFADNNSWAAAVVNYLVGLGDDAGQVNQGVGLYLSSGALTTQQQAFVNAGIQHFGAPPLLPAPVNGSTTGVTGGGTTATSGTPQVPGNLHVNKNGVSNAQITWDADGVSTTYDVLITSNAGHSVDAVVNGPLGVYTTFYNFPTVPGVTYTAKVTGKTATATGPSATVSFSG